VRVTVTERGPLVAALRIESDAPGCNKLSRELRVVDGLERVEIVDVVDKAKIPLAELLQGEPRKEGFYFGFAFHVPGGVMRMETPWAVVRPEVDQLPGACKNWFAVQRWVDISNHEYGVTWSPVDAPLVEVGAIAPQPTTPQSPEAWLRAVPPSTTLYSFVMNNYWTTCFRHDQPGPVTLRYSISPHGPFDAAQAARFGIEASQPLLVLPTGHARACGQPLMEVTPDDVIVTALKSAEDGTAWIVRLFGASGRATKATLRWPGKAPQAVRLSGLSEERGAKITAPVEVPGFGMVTLRVEW
jgi:alpha-mannosidase